MSHSRKCKCHRDKHERDAHKDILECVIQARFAAMPFATTPADIELFILPRSRQLPGKRVWDQTDIGPAGAAKACAFEILSCTFRTKHSYLRSTSSLSASTVSSTPRGLPAWGPRPITTPVYLPYFLARLFARLTCRARFSAATLHKESHRLLPKH